jgi:hypothetical protein
MEHSKVYGGRSKTKTIKERSIYVYLPSIETVKRWKNLASKDDVSISKFVFEHVENSLRSSDDLHERANLVDRVRVVEDENKQLLKDNRMLNKALENLEAELRSLRMRPFLDSDGSGILRYEKDLIHLFKTREMVKSDEILQILGIDPANSNDVKAITKQLENLEAYGLVKTIPGGWRWILKEERTHI